MDITKDTQRIISCCTGLRGIERGLVRAGLAIRPVMYLEIDAFICENLVCEMEAGLLAPAPIWTDLKTFDARPFRGLVDGIIGGYPCPPFSNAGKRLGTEDPRHLYPFISGIIKATGSVWCFFENVEGHLTLGYPEVSADLRNMGYAVEAGIYSAEEVGAPHQRDRLFILAIKQEFLEYARGAEPNRISSIKRKENIQVGNTGNVVNAQGAREWRGQRDIYKKNGRPNRELQFISNSASEEVNLPNTNNQRLPKSPCGEFGFIHNETGTFKGCKSSGVYAEDEWPARPGEQQYDWEEPRTIKSGLGCTIDGYNFREDLLRAYGNSVVEQTAEIAMIDLLKKHGLG